MPRVSNIKILKKNEQPVLSIRSRTKSENLPAFIGECCCKMENYLKEIDEFFSDVSIVVYHTMDMQNLDVEIGFPVSKILPEKGDIKQSSIPDGKVAFCMHRGAYAEAGQTYNEIAKWIEENGFKARSTVYEYYCNGAEFPESEKLMMMAIPIE